MGNEILGGCFFFLIFISHSRRLWAVSNLNDLLGNEDGPWQSVNQPPRRQDFGVFDVVLSLYPFSGNPLTHPNVLTHLVTFFFVNDFVILLCKPFR